MQGPLSIRSLASSTTPKLGASTTGEVHQQTSKKGISKQAIDATPIAIIGVMVTIACSMGVHTIWQNMFYSPSVQVTKTKRECVPEVDLPDTVIKSADNFLNKSFLRKVAHIQDKELTNTNDTQGHDTQGNQFTRYVP